MRALIPAALLFCACAPVDDAGPSGPGGPKGDGDDCQAEVDTWFLSEYAPLSCHAGPTCMGLVDPGRMPACGKQVSAAAWGLALQQHLLTPWRLQVNAARDAFMIHTSPVYQDHGAYLAGITPTAELRQAFTSLEAIPREPDASEYLLWVGDYQTLIDELATPLESQATLGLDLGGRVLCSSEPGGEVYEDCPYEPSLWLDQPELEVLSWLEEGRPAVDQDGQLGEWLSNYVLYLQRDGVQADLIDFSFPAPGELGLARHEADFLARWRSVSPGVHGPRDSRAWIGQLLVFLETARDGEPNDQLQVQLMLKSLSGTLVGAEAYASWLGTDLLQGGYQVLADDPARLAILMPLEPCAQDAGDLAAMQAAYQGAPRRPSQPPHRCR